MALTDGLISWWDLDETSGTRSDSHGSNDLLESGSVGTVTGHVGSGNAADFSGSTSEHLYIPYADAPDLQMGTGDMAFAMWCNGADPAVTNYGRIYAYGDEYENAGYAVERRNDTARVSFFFNEAADTTQIGGGDLFQVLDGTWRFLVVNVDRSANLTLNRDNGAETDTVDISGSSGLDIQSDEPFALGCSYDDSGNAHNFSEVSLDSVGVWNRTLTTSEIDTLWNSGNGVQYSDISSSSPTSTSTLTVIGA